MFRFVLAFLFLKSTMAWGLTLTEAIDLALKNSVNLKSQELELKKTEWGVIQSRSYFLPSLDLTAAHTYVGENPTTRTSDWDSSASIKLTENFYDHGLSIANHQISNTRKKLAELEYKREKSATILRTVQLYLDVLKAQKIERLQTRNTAQVEKVYGLIQSQYRQGIRTRPDFLRFEAQYQRAILSQADARYEVLRSLEDIKVHLNLPDAPKELADYKNENSTSVGDTEIYETSKKSLLLDLRGKEERIAKIDYWPQLDLVGQWGYGSDSYYQTGSNWSDNDRVFWNVGLVFNWNLWDWGRRKAGVEIAKAESLRQEVRANYDERDAKAAILKMNERWVLLEKQFEIAQKLLRAETEAFGLMERDFRQGQTSFLNYSTSLSDLISAEIQKIQTEYNLIQVRLELKHRKGFLDENSVQ